MLHSRLFSVPVFAALCGTLVLGANPNTCTTYATAGTGESCATIAAANGIDMYDFIGLNPDLISCVLTAGKSYCIGTNGTATTTLPPKPTSSSPAGTPTGGLIPSPDGSDGICGKNYTCLGSVYGDCCSANGYCGNSTEYCGEGCNSAFGRCGGGDETCPAAETVTIVQGPGACTVTLLSISTTTVSQLKTVTATATITVTSKATTTQPSAPRPTLDDTNPNCTKFYQLKANDTCQRISRSNGITISQLYNWNPSLDCDYPEGMAGYYICVAV